ncbi:DUF4292 domain-containing protein [Marixanthomonas spongiae]|uniref:DUF4292 domain-containing protein n=1 Tax=Marixanthomonas spongiae TaxID=2174845 RepID=A0A2U0I250_9FLAO|nr:DUF4292 domain-containing protein [Marixanthomonas spongiae]PVW15080.1 DUF4292 domain-containing protein [Marixanthomonas spongiae]
MKYTKFIFIALAIALSSCGAAKEIKGSKTANENLSVKNIIASHEAASPDFKTMAARIQVVYEDEDTQQSVTVSLRMEKNKTIWVKASFLGITLVKANITPDRVQYYETIGGTYFDGDYALLSDWLGTEINFEKAQAILLGQSIFNINKADYKSTVVQNKYKLQPKVQPQNFIHSLFLNPENFKIASESLSQPNNERLLSVRYNGYQKIGTGFYPSEIKINTTEKDSKTNIDVTYKKIDLDVNIGFPFNIPDGYEKIQL